MPIKYQYLLFIVLLHAVLTILIYFVLRDYKWYFILSETLIILSLALSYKIYASFIRPIELMKTGVNAIREEDFNVKFLETRSEEMNELIVVFNTMLDKLGEERVRTQEQAYFLESLISVSPIGMIILGYNGEITDINQSARTLLGVRAADDPSYLTEIHHPLIDHLMNMDSSDPRIISIDGIQKYRCQITEVVHMGFKRKFAMIEELSKEFLESEKEAYGKVIRMMAHEVNNSMGAINSILQSVMDFGFEGEGEENDYVASLNIAKSRNEDLARFMKNFAEVVRLPSPVLKRHDMVEIVEAVVGIMTPLAIEQNIQIDFIKRIEKYELLLDANLLQQALVNIIKNAIESIDRDGIVKVIVDEAQPHILVADNGSGISDEARPKLFSPFFSTKPTGQGIGLIVIRDILIGHHATFTLETDQDSGWTEFKIAF